jgi:Domain of unknown function (DUF5655)/Domain of unknown function (DUF4287)
VPAKAAPKPKYDVHPGVAMMRKWADELPAKTGRTLDQWAKLINNSGIDARKDRIAYLKDEHELGTNTAWHIVLYAEDQHSWDGDPDVYLTQAEQYVDGMFAGPKATLRPIFERLMAEARKLGKDVKVCPCKTIVPFYRDRVFAEVKPATKTRLELSFALKGVPFGGLLKPNPRADEKDRLKHQIHLATPADVTAEVLKWLKTAYDQDK